MDHRTVARAIVSILAGLLVAGLVLLFVPSSAQLTRPLTCGDGELLDRRVTFSIPGRTTVDLHYLCDEGDDEPASVTLSVYAVMTLYTSLLVFLGVTAYVRKKRRLLAAVPPDQRVPPEAADAGDETLRKLVAQGEKIRAIKLVREHYGVGLREAKEYVENLGSNEQDPS